MRLEAARYERPRVDDRVKATGTLGRLYRFTIASCLSDTGGIRETFTTAQVQTHSSAASCWAVIDGQVCDLTS